MADFEGKVVLVTGSATGLGAAIAIGAAGRGAKAVILNCTKSLKEAEATADAVRAASAEAEIAQGDVAEDGDCRKIAAVAARYGRIDALANNAASPSRHKTRRPRRAVEDDFLRLYAVNGRPVPDDPCLPQPARSGGSTARVMTFLAAVTGIGSSVAMPLQGALNTMTLSLARALAPKIRVNAIVPASSTRAGSPVRQRRDHPAHSDSIARTPAQAASKPEDIADPALFRCGRARHITARLMIDAGMLWALRR